MEVAANLWFLKVMGGLAIGTILFSVVERKIFKNSEEG